MSRLKKTRDDDDRYIYEDKQVKLDNSQTIKIRRTPNIVNANDDNDSWDGNKSPNKKTSKKRVQFKDLVGDVVNNNTTSPSNSNSPIVNNQRGKDTKNDKTTVKTNESSNNKRNQTDDADDRSNEDVSLDYYENKSLNDKKKKEDPPKTDDFKKNEEDEDKENEELPLSPSWYERKYNEEKAKSRKDQEIQTETGEQIYKSYYEYLQANSKGTQVEEDDKKTLSQMRFDLFKKNIHLKYNVNVPLFEIRKEVSEIEEADNNRTFWDYLNYNNKKPVLKERLKQREKIYNRNKSIWDNDDEVTIEDVDEEEFYRRNNRMRNSARDDQTRFIWQIDEF